MEAMQFLRGYAENIKINEENGGWELTLPFRFFNNDANITLHIQENENGYFDIDDKGSTLKYLNNIDCELSKYSDKIEIICELFSLKIEENLIKGVIGYGKGSDQTFKQLHNFLQGISHLSTIKYFD